MHLSTFLVSLPIILIICAYIPLFLRVWNRTAQPNIATFTLWIVTGACAVTTTIFSGGETPYVGLGFIISNFLLIGLLLKTRSWSWGRKENIALSVVVVSVIIWFVTDATYGLYAIVLGNYLGAGVPSLIDAYKNPQKTQVLTWFLFSLASFVNILVITNTAFESYVYPFAALVFNALVALAHAKSLLVMLKK